jgi:uncharacterized membrane protein
MPVFIAFLGLAIDGGFMLAEQQAVRAAADLAAVDGAFCMAFPTKPQCTSAETTPGAVTPHRGAHGAAITVAGLNGYRHNVAGSTVTVEKLSSPDRLRVTINTSVATRFARIVNISSFPLTARATAQAMAFGPTVPLAIFAAGTCADQTSYETSGIQISGHAGNTRSSSPWPFRSYWCSS